MGKRDYNRSYNYGFSTGVTSASEMNSAMLNILGLGTLFDAFRTIKLPDGRWLSITGDATAEAGQTFPVYDNAAVIWDDSGPHRIDTTNPGGHFFPRWRDNTEFWPNQFFVVDDRGYAFGTRVLPSEGQMNWIAYGTYGAVFEVPYNGDPKFLNYFPTPSSLLDDQQVQWQAGVYFEDPLVYIHGTKVRPEAYHANDGGYIAVVELAKLEVPHRWRFWNGSDWVNDHTQAVTTIPIWNTPLTNGTSNGYTVHRRPNGQWQVTTKYGGDISEGMDRYIADSPTGPWTREQILPASQVRSFDDYMAGAAPTIPTRSGNLLVQVSQTNSYPIWFEVPQ